jgi:hypothetical protein
VLAAVALARRIPGGSSLAFATREGISAALSTPAHKNRPKPYRLHVVGPDLAPQSREATLAALRADPHRSLHWYDANVWTPEDALELEGMARSWFNVARTHHPFPAVEAAAAPLTLDPDPFGDTLLAMAESRLPPQEENDWGRIWRDALEALSGSPLALPSSVTPLVRGIPAGISPLDRGEADALRTELTGLLAHSRTLQVPSREGKVVLLVLPEPRRQPATALALAAMDGSGCDYALVLYDRGDQALLIGRRHGADPPADVRPAFERLLTLSFVSRDRLARGSASVRLADPPRDALERLVAGLL